MVKTKDRWSALSMKERADLIKLYVDNGITSLDTIKKDYNFSDGGRLLKGDEDEQTLSGKPWYQKLIEFGQSARDARVGALGAQQVRDLYSEGKTEEAKELAKKYAKANTTGIALAGGFASPNLITDLLITGATTAADTAIDGNIQNFGKHFLLNASADIIGRGAGKGIEKAIKAARSAKLAKTLNNTELDGSILKEFVDNNNKTISFEVKDAALKDAITFEEGLSSLGKSQQIEKFNKFAKKYGYDEITDVNISNETLDNLTKQMLERHNTFFRGVRPSEEISELASKLNISEEEALKIAATTPRVGETHIFVSPTNNASIYGGGEYTARIKRPYSLGNDRTNWFNEANFEIMPGQSKSGVLNDAEVMNPWFSYNIQTDEVSNELLLKRGEFVDWVSGPLEGSGSRNRIFTKKNFWGDIDIVPLEKFKNGGEMVVKKNRVLTRDGVNKFDNGSRILFGEEDAESTLSGESPSKLQQNIRKAKVNVMRALRQMQWESPSEAIMKVFQDTDASRNFARDYYKNVYDDVAQDSYLFSKKEHENAFLNSGYIKGSPGDYGLVKKAVGDRNLPVYQAAKDDASREDLTVIGNISNIFFGNNRLTHAGSFPTAIYKDAEGNIYQKAWDLQNYGPDANDSENTYSHYDKIRKVGATLLDIIGNPVVRTTGFQKLDDSGIRALLINTIDKKLWKELIATSAKPFAEEVINLRILGAYEDYISTEASKKATHLDRNSERYIYDFENIKEEMRKNITFDAFKSNIEKYYLPETLDKKYFIFK